MAICGQTLPALAWSAIAWVFTALVAGIALPFS